jgi:hypothetical protein
MARGRCHRSNNIKQYTCILFYNPTASKSRKSPLLPSAEAPGSIDLPSPVSKRFCQNIHAPLQLVGDQVEIPLGFPFHFAGPSVSRIYENSQCDCPTNLVEL